jgi:hypothetical protein
MFSKVLVEDRGEIAVLAFRAAYELGAGTVAIFLCEVRGSEHRFRADEAYEIGQRGKHRSYRKSACLMEMAGYLAGECWSDHPECTHPLLAEFSRLVNDHTSDVHRTQLAELIRCVIGVTSRDVHVDARVALTCARAALPIVSAERRT